MSLIKTSLAVVGVVAIVGGVVLYNKNPELFSSLTSSFSGSSPSVSVKKADPEKETRELTADPEGYLTNARKNADRSLARMKELEAALRSKQKRFAARAAQKEGELAASKLTLEKIKTAVKAADAKFGKDSPEWACDWPYAGSPLSRKAVAERAVQAKEESDFSAKLVERYRALDFAFSKKIVIVSDKRSQVSRAIPRIDAALEYVRAGNDLREADRLAEDVCVSLDMSDVFFEMESLDTLILDTARADGIEARKDAVFAKILSE